MIDHVALFQKNPITFLRTFPLFPPNGNGVGTTLGSWDVHGLNFEGGEHQRLSVVNARQRLNIRFAASGSFPGAVTFDATDRPIPRSATDVVRTWWLPWKSHAFMRLTIPAIPTSLVDIEEHDHPRFFMTSGLSGCSVMVEGPPNSPTVYHAGLNEVKLGRPADRFWAEQLQNARSQVGENPFAPVRTAHKNDYLIADTPEARRFIEWRESSASDGFKLELLQCFGSVVGVRFGRHWSFYLQSNAVTQKVEILKRRDVESSTNGIYKGYTDRRDGGVVQRIKTTEKGRFGTEKTVRTYLKRSGSTAQVLNVSEYYPRRTFSSDFMGKITVKS